jgi:hypothetical protein
MSQPPNPNASPAQPGWAPPSAGATTYAAPPLAPPAVWYVPPATDPYAEQRADELARGIARYERISGVVWIVLGVIQIFTFYLALAGVWNIFAGITRLTAAPAIQRRESRVPAMFAGVVGLILIGLVNLFVGAVFGIVMVAVDFYIRQRILDNRQIFNR